MTQARSSHLKAVKVVSEIKAGRCAQKHTRQNRALEPVTFTNAGYFMTDLVIHLIS